MKLALRAWPPSPPEPLSPTARHTANERGQMCKRACEAVAPASSPERCQRTSPTHCHKEPRENMDLAIASPLQGIAARRARERHARNPCQNTFSRAARAKIFYCFAERIHTPPREARSEIFCTQPPKNASVSPAPRTPANRKQAKKCKRFPRPADASEEKNEGKNASVSPAPRTPPKRKQAKKCERFPLRRDGRKRRSIPEHARKALAPDF